MKRWVNIFPYQILRVLYEEMKMVWKISPPPKIGVSRPSAVSAVETTVTFLLGNIALLICVGFAQIRRVFRFRNFVFVFHTRRRRDEKTNVLVPFLDGSRLKAQLIFSIQGFLYKDFLYKSRARLSRNKWGFVTRACRRKKYTMGKQWSLFRVTRCQIASCSERC